jgi:TolA-binding protein
MKQLKYITAAVLLSLSSLSFAKAVVPAARPSSALPHKSRDEALLIELTGKDISKESDTALYAEMVSAYQHEDEIGFKSRLQNMITRFPKSAYADNALYLAGRMAVDHNRYPEAIRYFARVEKEYPHGDKVIAARFAKAMTYKKMNLPEFAKKSLADVRTRYPGSPESFRADAELRMMN